MPQEQLPAPTTQPGNGVDSWLGPDFLGSLHDPSILALPVIARITTTPALLPIPVQWYWQHDPSTQIVKVFHKASISYTEHGRADRSRTVEYSSNSLNALFDFAGEIVGGVLDTSCSLQWSKPNGQTGTTGVGRQTFQVLGDNPDHNTIRSKMGDVQLRVIAYKESRFRQFDAAGLPLFGPPGGFGVMQIDTPPPTTKQVWDWQANVAAGGALHGRKKKEVNQHFQNLYAAHPDAPKLTAEQSSLALYQYYNGGWYWDWDDNAKLWQKTGDTSYADEAATIEQAVLRGQPPGDW